MKERSVLFENLLDNQSLCQIESVINDYQFGYPQILKGEGACPPEDVGGIEKGYGFRNAGGKPWNPEATF